MYLYDPEFYLMFGEAMAPGGPVAALVALRAAGVVDHLGVVPGDIRLVCDLIGTGVFEVALVHNRYTLDRSADALIEEAIGLGVACVNAAPYGGGILSRGPDVSSEYAYGPVDEVLLTSVYGMQEACRRRGVPLAAAALQSSLRDPRVPSTVVGVSTAERVVEAIRLAELDLADELWNELASLTPLAEYWLS